MLSKRVVFGRYPVASRATEWSGAPCDKTQPVVRYQRISVDPRQMGGVPCIHGLRIPVATVIEMVADGMTTEEILASHPDLQREDIAEALRYAAEAVRERELPLRTGP